MIVLVIKMQIKQFLSDYFHTTNILIEKLNKGLTNTIYIVIVNNRKYLLRVPKKDHHQIVHRHHEMLALKCIANLNIDAKLVYYNEENGLKMNVFIDHALTYKECNSSTKIEEVAKLMKFFHANDKKIGVEFQPIERYFQYKKYTTNYIFNVLPFENIIPLIQELTFSLTLCHNDWVDGNILFTNEKTYLIDYEYAADNDPLFDVVSFLSENKIFDIDLRKRFYEEYFDSFGEKEIYRMSLWEKFQNLLWCMWAMMMFESRKEIIYYHIAQDKYKALTH